MFMRSPFLPSEQNRRKKSKAKQKKGGVAEEQEGSRGDGLAKPALHSDVQPSPYLAAWDQISEERDKSATKDHFLSSSFAGGKISSSDSEYSDAEGAMQSKTRFVAADRWEQRPGHNTKGVAWFESRLCHELVRWPPCVLSLVLPCPPPHTHASTHCNMGLRRVTCLSVL